MKELIEKKQELTERGGTGSFHKTVSKLADRAKRAANEAEFIKSQVARAARAKWGIDAMDVQELDGHMQKATDALSDAEVMLGQWADLLK